MFSWICPKCGKEVPPAYSECPNCSPQDQPAPPEAPPSPATLVQPPPPRPAPRQEPSRPAVPAWLLSLMFAAILILSGVAFLTIHSAKRSEPVSSPAAALETPSAEPSPAAAATPAFKNLELAGFRLTEDSKQTVFLQCVVVNHSAADLGEVGAKANLDAVTNRKSLEPVGTFSFRTTLGPYESKDLKVPVDTKMRVYELPDWQFLRAEITGQ